MFANYILLVIKPPKLKAVVFKNAFRLKFNTYAFTRFSICKEVALRLITAKKLTDFCRLIYYTSLRHLSK
jgi:hypothetical protein